MIHSHRTQSDHTFIRQDDSIDPRLVRVLGSGHNYDTVRYYLDEGYEVQVGTPLMLTRLGIGRTLLEGCGELLDVDVYPYVDAQPSECGGWRDVTTQDIVQLQMQRDFLELAPHPSAEWPCPSRLGIASFYERLPLAPKVTPLVQRWDWAAIFVAGLGDPRWYVDPEQPNNPSILFSSVGLTGEPMGYSFSAERLRLTALSCLVFGEEGPLGAKYGFEQKPFGRAYVEALSDVTSLKGYSSLTRRDVSDAACVAMSMAAHYIWRVWYCGLCDIEFDPEEMLDGLGVEYYRTHIL